MGKPIDFEGRKVYPIFTIDLDSEVEFSLLWKNSNSNFKQGIQIKIDKGTIEVNDEKLSSIVLWQDTCPEKISLRCMPKKNAKLKVWNVWQVDDLVQAWVGNSGIEIEKYEDGEYRLNCSDGPGAPDFGNTTFELKFPYDVSF